MSSATDEEARVAAWARLTRVGFLVGFASREDPFYLLMTLSEMPLSEFLVEIAFYPEYVDLDGRSSDLVVEWGGLTHMREWVRQFLCEFHVHPAPESVQMQVRNRLFDSAAPAVIEVDPADPWFTRYP